MTGIRQLVVAGGVSANQTLRRTLTETLRQIDASVYYAPTELCTDNGAMIAYAGFCRLSRGQSDDLAVRCIPRWDMTTLGVSAHR